MVAGANVFRFAPCPGPCCEEDDCLEGGCFDKFFYCTDGKISIRYMVTVNGVADVGCGNCSVFNGTFVTGDSGNPTCVFIHTFNRCQISWLFLLFDANGISVGYRSGGPFPDFTIFRLSLTPLFQCKNLENLNIPLFSGQVLGGCDFAAATCRITSVCT